MRRTPLSIRGQIILVLFTCFAVVIGMLGMGFIGLRNADFTINRIRLANYQLHAMTQLNVASNRHSEQIAELLVLGGRERADLESSRLEMAEALGRLKRLVEEELALLRDPAERSKEIEELNRVEAMRAKFAETDRIAEEIARLQAIGQNDAAVSMFRTRIEGGLDDELENMIEAAIAGEREEVASAEADAAALYRKLMLLMIGLSLFSIAGATAAGYFLYRSVANPLQLLTKGAQAIAQGKLDYRISSVKGTEFGFLASQFNEMSEGLEQRNRQLLEARADLERKVVKRTEELAEANSRLVELDRQRIRFLADASHELRTPLTVLRGEADVALRSRSNSQDIYRDALERIVVQAEDMARLVEDLLFLARSESDDVRFETAKINPAVVVAEAVNGINSLARRRGVQLSLADASTATPVTADPRRLKQAVTIILENAIKYSPQRSRIDVGVSEDSVGDKVISIRDTGIGIPEGELPHIFDRFFRGESARAESSGSGLGLTIARSIVEKHGGRIEVNSAVGKGTEAKVVLPVNAHPA